MVKPFHTPVYQPMSDSDEVMAEYQEYLKSLDKEYGTQFSVQELERTGEKKMDSTNEFEELFKAGLKESEETEDHFDDKEDELEPEDPGYDEDEVLVEEPQAPYTTKDLALGVIDLLNNADLDFNDGYDEDLEKAFTRLELMPVMSQLTRSDWDDIYDGEFSKIQKVIEDNPDQAERVFNAVARAFGYSNYQDYKTYRDWVDDGGELDYSDLNEATNPGAIANTPGSHTILTVDEDEEEIEYEEC